MDYFGFFGVIDSFFSSVFSVVILWLLSIFLYVKLDEFVEIQEKVKEKEGRKSSDETIKANSPLVASIENAENFVALFNNWLFEVDHIDEGPPSVLGHIHKLQNAEKELKKIQMVIDSLEKQIFYRLNPTKDHENERIRGLLEKFEHTKVYVELRHYLLHRAQTQLKLWLQRGKSLKIWLSDSMALQEQLHREASVAEAHIAEHLQLQKILIKESVCMETELGIWKNILYQMTDTLKEVGNYSKKFECSLGKKTCDDEPKRWSEVLIDALNEEVTSGGDGQRWIRFFIDFQR
ncbi:uncharacterized protein LOC128469837 isoform X2 [Spea bombifrons]|uniref:uncharacterized protein LOC128469837 isoform X2 n=1 Tax=Spea bombifrons TaxID=233779 RepID=UPI00234B4923|nr:uncharacterized protein LOC128469837 isoform X2 [Spea bombifrons]